MNENMSPYLDNENRLADVLAAIQVLGTYKFYKSTPEKWAKRINGIGEDVATGVPDAEVERWKGVLEEHSEFFRFSVSRKNVSLVWRRQFQKRYSVDKKLEITKAEFGRLDGNEKKRVSRRPLSDAEMAKLLDLAVNMHSRALEHRQDERWWITHFTSLMVGLMGVAGTILGVLVGASLKNGI